MTPASPSYGSIYDPSAARIRPTFNFKRIALFIQNLQWGPKISFRSKVISGSKNFEIGSRDPGHAHLGSIYIPYMQEGSVLHLNTKFQADHSFPSNVIRLVPKFEIGSRDRKPHPF